MRRGTSARMGMGCLILFALPFAGIGLFVLGLAVRDGLRQSRPGREVAILAVLGLAFAVAGFAILAMGIWGGRRVARDEERKAQYPDEPWKWREDWADGRIRGGGKPAVAAVWVFALLWNLISAPIFFFGREQILEKGGVAYIAFVFPLVGVLLLIWAVRSTIGYVKFGGSVFEMSPFPAAAGGALSGRVHARLARPPEGGVRARVSCIHRTVTRSGRNSTTHESVLWQDEAMVPAGSIQPGPHGYLVPVSFPLPPDALPTRDEDSRDSHLWRLEVEAAVPGVDYGDRFEVPVYGKTTVSAAPVAAPVPPPAPASPTVGVRPTAESGVELDFLPARNRGAAVALTFFFVLWTGVVLLIRAVHAPLLFLIVFGFFDVLLFLGVITLWLGRWRCAAGPGEVTTEFSLLGLGRRRRVAASEVERVDVSRGMQSGTTAYWDVRLVLRGGRKIVAGRTVRDRREAEWLASLLRDAFAGNLKYSPR